MSTNPLFHITASSSQVSVCEADFAAIQKLFAEIGARVGSNAVACCWPYRHPSGRTWNIGVDIEGDAGDWSLTIGDSSLLSVPGVRDCNHSWNCDWLVDDPVDAFYLVAELVRQLGAKLELRWPVVDRQVTTKDRT